MALKVRYEHLSCALLRRPHPAPLHTCLVTVAEQRFRNVSSLPASDLQRNAMAYPSNRRTRLLTYVKTIQTRSNIVRCFQRIAFYLTREVSPPDPNHSDVPRATGRM